MNNTDLAQLLDVLRSKGVTEFEHDGLRVKLGPIPATEPVEEVKAIDNPKPPRKAGKDGLFAEEQLAAYGRVIDAEG